MQKALYDILIEQPYLYRYEMADFLYCRFRKKDIGKIDQSDWLRQRNAIHRQYMRRRA